jgi:hypothetical protein
MGSNPPNFYYDGDQKGQLRLAIAPINKPQIFSQVHYMGEICFRDLKSLLHMDKVMNKS